MTEPSTPPLRTWRPMILWTAAILLALGLAWFIGVVVVPVWQVRTVLLEPSVTSQQDDIRRLGGADNATSKLGRYMGMPDAVAPRKPEAAALLVCCGSQAIPVLVRASSSTDPEVRGQAFESLGRLGRGNPPVVPILVRALDDQDAVVRRHVAYALGIIGPEAREAVPALIRACNDTDRVVAGSAESALGFIGRDAVEAVPTLIGGLKNQDSLVRMCATYGLGGIGPGASRAVPALIAALSDPDASVREGAARALGEIGPTATAAVPALRKLLNDQKNVSNEAYQALQKITGRQP